jgi:hypothetical protein
MTGAHEAPSKDKKVKKKVFLGEEVSSQTNGTSLVSNLL